MKEYKNNKIIKYKIIKNKIIKNKIIKKDNKNKIITFLTQTIFIILLVIAVKYYYYMTI